MLNKKFKAVVFDLDGTLYIGDTVVAGAVELIESLKENGIRPFYFTNNSTKTRKQILTKLLKMGFELTLEEVYTSAFAAASYVKGEDITNVYCVGSEGLKEEFRENGINVSSSSSEINAVVIGLDTSFNYEKLGEVLNIIRNDCKIIACNRDKNFPVEGNRLMPGCGPIVSAIEGCFSKSVDYVVGKPGTYMIEQLAKDWGFHREDLLVVGDCYEYDIEMANAYECASVLITDEDSDLFKDTTKISKLTDLEKLININN